MMSMRLEKLRQADLNLLVTFAAIAEEKSITAAASRLFLSQPAVSRPCSAHARCFRMIFSFDRRTASNSLCEVERFLTSLRECYPEWRISYAVFCLKKKNTCLFTSLV